MERKPVYERPERTDGQPAHRGRTNRPAGRPQAAPQPDPDPIPQVEARDMDTGVPVSQVAPTIINEDVTIDSSLSCRHDMLFSCSIKGNVKCDGKLTVRGYIFGNVVAAQVELCGARIRGNTVCNGFMTMDEGSMIVGDVESENLILGGKIKGDVTVRGQADVRQFRLSAGRSEVGGLAIQQGRLPERPYFHPTATKAPARSSAIWVTLAFFTPKRPAPAGPGAFYCKAAPIPSILREDRFEKALWPVCRLRREMYIIFFWPVVTNICAPSGPCSPLF